MGKKVCLSACPPEVRVSCNACVFVAEPRWLDQEESIMVTRGVEPEK